MGTGPVSWQGEWTESIGSVRDDKEKKDQNLGPRVKCCQPVSPRVVIVKHRRALSENHTMNSDSPIPMWSLH